MPEEPHPGNVVVSFETGGASYELAEVSGTAVVSSARAHGNGTYSLKVATNTSDPPDYGKIWGRNISGQLDMDDLQGLRHLVVYVCFETLPVSGWQYFLGVRDASANELFYCGVSSIGWRLYDSNGSNLTVPPITISLGQWYEIAFEFTTTGANDISMWVEGVKKVDNQGDAGTAHVRDIILGRPTTPGSSDSLYSIYYDDIIGRDDELPGVSMAAGGRGYEVLLFGWSSQTGCDTDWNGDGGNIDEDPPPSTADFVYCDEGNSATDAETIRFDGSCLDILNSDDAIEVIAPWLYYACQNTVPVAFGQMKMKTYVGTTTDYTAAIPIKSATWGHLSWPYFANPDDDGDWEKSDLFEDLQIGVEAVVVPPIADRDMRVATVWLMVAREIPAGAAKPWWYYQRAAIRRAN